MYYEMKAPWPLVLLLVLGTGASLPGLEAIGYATMAEEEPWSWKTEKVGPIGSMIHNSGDYDISISKSKKGGGQVALSISKDARMLHKWTASRNASFMVYRRMLYFIDCQKGKSSPDVVAVDLVTGKEEWRSALRRVSAKASSQPPVSDSFFIEVKVKYGGSTPMVCVFTKGVSRCTFEMKHYMTGQMMGYRTFPAPPGEVEQGGQPDAASRRQLP